MKNYNESLEVILIRLEKQISFIVKKMKQKDNQNPDKIFFDNQEFISLMNISKRTAQEWRNKEIINFSQIGNKIYYRLSDIMNLLNENYNIK